MNSENATSLQMFHGFALYTSQNLLQDDPNFEIIPSAISFSYRPLIAMWSKGWGSFPPPLLISTAACDSKIKSNPDGQPRGEKAFPQHSALQQTSKAHLSGAHIYRETLSVRRITPCQAKTMSGGGQDVGRHRLAISARHYYLMGEGARGERATHRRQCLRKCRRRRRRWRLDILCDCWRARSQELARV